MSLFAAAAVGWPFAGYQLSFRTPEEAGTALFASIEAGDQPRFLSVAGSLMAPFLNSGHADRDEIEKARLIDAVHRRGVKIVSRGSDRFEVYLGGIPDAFPAPLVKTESGWRFDAEAGVRGLTARRIQANEMAVLEQCRRFRDAEMAFHAQRRNGSGRYAARVRSSPGERDGLFWSDPDSEDESPIGPSFAGAFVETQLAGTPVPLFGYYFKILTAQGPDAPGGPADYLVDGQLRNGFAMVAWPAQYGVSGVRSFLINHLGDLHQKDLGPDTAHAAGISTYNPDSTWRRVETHDE